MSRRSRSTCKSCLWAAAISSAGLLVRDVHRAVGRFRVCVPDELVAGPHHLKHGMITVRKANAVPASGQMPVGMVMPTSPSADGTRQALTATQAQKPAMTVLGIAILVLALVIVRTVGA